MSEYQSHGKIFHPELKEVDPEDYPDIHKLRILSDVAPYSREYNTYRQKISSEAKYDTGLQIELDIIDRVRQVKESSIRMDERRFTEPVEAIEGTIEEATPAGIRLQEYPGRIFRFSSVGTSAADMSAAILGENNQGFPSSATTRTSRTRAGAMARFFPGCVLDSRTESPRAEVFWLALIVHGLLFPRCEKSRMFGSFPASHRGRDFCIRKTGEGYFPT